MTGYLRATGRWLAAISPARHLAVGSAILIGTKRSHPVVMQAEVAKSLNGFGKFKVKATPACEGRNPSTGETIQIKPAKKLTFGPAKAVKDRLNG